MHCYLCPGQAGRDQRCYKNMQEYRKHKTLIGIYISKIFMSNFNSSCYLFPGLSSEMDNSLFLYSNTASVLNVPINYNHQTSLHLM